MTDTVVPTQWAYEQACKALDRHRVRGDTYRARALALLRQLGRRDFLIELAQAFIDEAKNEIVTAVAAENAACAAVCVQLAEVYEVCVKDESWDMDTRARSSDAANTARRLVELIRFRQTPP